MNSPSLRAAVAAAVLLSVPAASRADDAADPHAHHHMMMMGESMRRAQRTTADYKLPDVQLVRDDGVSVPLAKALDDGRPVAVEFIFTTCTTICPVMSRVFARLQEKLGGDRDRVQLVSISIDPEQDTPARLAEYARRYHAGPGWRFYTGTTEASVAAQRAFDAYRGDKMDHTPVTFLRAAPGRRWVRIDGFATADELARELHELVAAR
jgi:protein SCO1/2